MTRTRRKLSAADPPGLLGGPYAAPILRGRRTLFCAIRGDVRIAGNTEAPIRWPYTPAPGGKRSLVIAGDLVAALHTESSLAIQYHFGVARKTVTRLRRRLGIGAFTPGTVALWRELMPARLGPDGARKGGLATRGKAKGGRRAEAQS